MTSPATASCGSKRSSYSHSSSLPEEDSRNGFVGGAMLPIFLNDLTSHGNHHSQDLVEVTLELDDDDDDIVVYSVAPVPNDLSEEAGTGILGRSLSVTSRSIRRTLGRLIRSSSSRTVASSDSVDLALPAREARKLKAKLQRTRSSAQRALNGLRFISKTTGASDAEELWKQVEARFESLAVDGLLARADFGQCIGKDLKTPIKFDRLLLIHQYVRTLM